MDLFSIFSNHSNISQLEPQQVNAMISQPSRPFLLDVRTPQEYQGGHINGAELIPLNELPQKMSRIPKNREIICVCASGSRSSAAANHLSSAGYKVSNLRGGMMNWMRAGLPVKTGAAK
ncbi:MAG: rhodanese-like domain-containing protein [Anaerolineaceae bacterium]|nr:rhodanese-like domain-containing protein [Anaerolineaceae bacterium]